MMLFFMFNTEDINKPFILICQRSNQGAKKYKLEEIEILFIVST